MIITKEMFDEFVESAENQNILWTDTLALIGVTVGDVPDVDVIEAQAAEIARLREAVKPFVGIIGKSGEKVTITIGADTWTHVLTTVHFEELREAYRINDENYQAWKARAALAQETQP